MSIPIFQVDAFVTEKKFSGNPAAVCVLPAPADARWMQGVAMEMNLSETAFLVRKDDGFDLRWFTPAVEIALCSALVTEADRKCTSIGAGETT